MKWVSLKLLFYCAGLITLALFVCSVQRGVLRQDDGWCLYGALLVGEGQTPYVDFATTQGPVMPYVYALGHPLVSAMGVVGGRYFTALLALACIAVSVVLGRRMVQCPGQTVPMDRRTAVGILVLCLIGVNVFQVYYFSIVKTYALAALLLMSGFLALSFASQWPRLGPLLGGVLIMLAAGTRASAAFALPATFVVMVWSAWQQREAPAPTHRAWLWFFVGATATALLLFVPFALAAPEALWFAMVEYHTGREPGSLLQGIAYKGGFLARCIQDYSVAALALLGLLCLRQSGRPGSAPLQVAPQFDLLKMAWASVVLISVVHFMAPFPYDDYQVMVYPLFCVALACSVVRACSALDSRGVTVVVLAVFLSCTAIASASPVLHGWFLGTRDRIWWPLKDKAPLAVLQETAQLIMARQGGAPGQALLLTQDPYLAVETGMALPAGFELGQFCYFPDWSAEKATACHVLNRETFREALRNMDADVAAFSGYGLAIQCPDVQPIPSNEVAELWGILEARYRDVDQVDPFGQADTRLRILIRR